MPGPRVLGVSMSSQTPVALQSFIPPHMKGQQGWGVVGDGRGSGYFVLLRKNTLLSRVLARTVPHTTKVKDTFGVDLGLLNKNLIGTNILGKERAIPTPKIFYF